MHIEVPARERSSDGLSADGMSVSLDLYLQGLANQHQESGPAPSFWERWPTDEREVRGKSFYGCHGTVLREEWLKQQKCLSLKFLRLEAQVKESTGLLGFLSTAGTGLPSFSLPPYLPHSLLPSLPPSFHPFISCLAACLSGFLSSFFC